MRRRMHAPLEIAEIFVDADRAQRPPARPGEIGHDHRRVAKDRQHRMTLIDRALSDIGTRMRVRVGKHLQLFFFVY